MLTRLFPSLSQTKSFLTVSWRKEPSGSLNCTVDQQDYVQAGESPLHEPKAVPRLRILLLQNTEPIFNCLRSRFRIIHSVPLCL